MPAPRCGPATSLTTMSASTPTTARDTQRARVVKTESGWVSLVDRVAAVLVRLEQILPAPTAAPDWRALAYRWRKSGRGVGHLQTVAHPHRITLDDLQVIDDQKRAVDRNTRQFVAGLPSNNVLLTGSRGTGKSSLVKALLVKYAAKGLRLIEVEKGDLVDLPDIVESIAGRPERFIVFCDDLSFDANEPGY